MQSVLFVAILFLVALAWPSTAQAPSSPIPISSSSYAFSRGSLSSATTVDLWIDLGCSDCLNDWPLLEQVYDKYSDDVRFNYHLFPLPYHQFAFLLAKSANCVALHGSPGDVFNFFDTLYTPSNQALIYNSATANMTYNEVMTTTVSKFVTDSSDSLSASDFLDFMASDYDCEQNTRYQFKNAALSSIYGTPMYTINGVTVTDGLSTIEDWTTFLDGLVSSPL